MSTEAFMAKVISSLDWQDDLGPAPLSGQETQRLRSRIGDGAARWVAGAVEQSLAALESQIDDSLAPWHIFRAFGRRVLASALLRLAGDDEPPADKDAIDRVIAEDSVAREIPLSVITRALRTAQREWLSRLIDAALAFGPDGIRLIPDLATSLTETLDAWIGAAADAVAEERRRVYLVEQMRVRTAIESLVAAVPVDVEAASRLLGVPLGGWHLGCAIGAAPGIAVERRVLDGIVHLFAREAGNGRMLRHESSSGTVHLWVTAEQRPRTPRVDDLRVTAPLVVGIGEPHRGAEGFRRTFVEASDSLTLAVQLGKRAGLSYGDSALAILLSQDEERARWFAEHELRDLARDDREAADLRKTLRTFFDTRMRVAPAAERLFVHRNTLISRLERIQSILGHSITERTAETQAALVLAELVAARESDGRSNSTAFLT